MFVCVCVCVMELESSGCGTIVGTRNLHTYYTLYCVCMITSRRTQGAAAEKDAVQSDHVRLVVTRDTSYCTRCQSRGQHQTHTDIGKKPSRM